MLPRTEFEAFSQTIDPGFNDSNGRDSGRVRIIGKEGAAGKKLETHHTCRFSVQTK